MTAYDDYNASGYTRPEIVPADWQRLAVLQTERAYLDRELIRAGNHSRTAASTMCERRDAIDALIRKELPHDL